MKKSANILSFAAVGAGPPGVMSLGVPVAELGVLVPTGLGNWAGIGDWTEEFNRLLFNVVDAGLLPRLKFQNYKILFSAIWAF